MQINIELDSKFALNALLVLIVLILLGASRLHKAIPRLFSSRRRQVSIDELIETLPVDTIREGRHITTLVLNEKERKKLPDEEIRTYKDLYFKLQNLERFPTILAQAREKLAKFFSETLAEAQKEPDTGILSIESYSSEALASFLQGEDDKTTRQWAQYLERRKKGSPRELFSDTAEAKIWLKQTAPVKYVDGAWLGHINKITTPFNLRRVTKDAWQVLSEEYGDGDLDKNHVHVYRDLMRDIEAGLPEGYTEDFIKAKHNLNSTRVWRAAVGQLLISLFPHEFLPEILGFNMHFELLTVDTLKATKELEEVKLNNYYFVLHISIDNADSGHTAMAMQTVVDYIENIKKAQGNAAAQLAWKRIQAGYNLSAHLPSTPEPSDPNSDNFPRNPCEAEMIRIFRAKSSVAQQIHCSSRLKIGRRTLVEWLAADSFGSKQRQMEFLHDLSNMKPWIRKGNSENSRFIQYLSWKGKMFGSFTQKEVDVVKKWIDSFTAPDPDLYWSFVGRTKTPSSAVPQLPDIRSDYPVFEPSPAIGTPVRAVPATTTPYELDFSRINIPKLIPLWFTHPCLLESFISIPAKTTNPLSCAIIRLLRAQYGFGTEGPGVAGMDEVRRAKSTGLVDLGLEVLSRAGLPRVGSLREVLDTWPSDFSLTMLALSMRPDENTDLLLGLAMAFLGLQEAMARSPLLSGDSQEVLAQIVRRERDSLDSCLGQLEDDETRCADCSKGYALGKMEIEKCFLEGRS
ncbi:hypothetical protein MMC19_006021 [Ptychographa xylographoides]|nr:hypothetical protein [Ptychographa xylographoides]